MSRYNSLFIICPPPEVELGLLKQSTAILTSMSACKQLINRHLFHIDISTSMHVSDQTRQ